MTVPPCGRRPPGVGWVRAPRPGALQHSLAPADSLVPLFAAAAVVLVLSGCGASRPDTEAPMKDPIEILADVEQPEERRIEAARALGRAKSRDAIDRMFAVTERAETLLTGAVMEALKEMGAHEVLARRLANADPAVRADAARKLSKLQDERATDSLLKAARDNVVEVRRASVHALSYLKGPRVFDALRGALRDSDAETRAYAAAGLGRSGDPRAARILGAAREAEQDEVVKDFIDGALRKLGAQPQSPK